MKPDKRQLATLHDMETWAYKVKKDAKEWKRNVENVFHEELRFQVTLSFFLIWIWILRCLNYLNTSKKPKMT